MLRVVLLGSPVILLDDQPIRISRRKAEALFFYLAATRRAHTRDHLCTLLWPDDAQQSPRAELRRMLSTLNRSLLAEFIEADRHTVSLTNTEAIEVDLWQFDDALNAADWSVVSEQIEHWTLPFLQGFSAGDAPQFDDWQQLVQTQLHQRLIPVIERLVMQAQATGNDAGSIRLLLAWLQVEPDNERVHRWLIRRYAETDQSARALSHVQTLADPEPETRELTEQIRRGQPVRKDAFAGGVLPPMPHIMVGRDAIVNALRQKLGIYDEQRRPRLLVVQGWPGIGKTTITAALAHDPLVQRHFKDGVLWASLGQTPDIFASLVKWGSALGLPDIGRARTDSDASDILRNALHDRHMLLIVDDVWDEAHFGPFNVGGRRCATLVTSRLNRVAQSVITRPDQFYKIPVLDEDDALQLLRILAPDAVRSHPDEIRELVRDVEGLPLALQVIGRLLREEQSLGWGARELLAELRDGTRLLTERAPVDRQINGDDVPLTVSALLSLSTNSLDDATRKRFALLGVFAPKPAVFELDAMQAVWEVNDGRSTVRRLVERGLLEVVAGGEFQMHALLVQHARLMFGNTV